MNYIFSIVILLWVGSVSVLASQFYASPDSIGSSARMVRLAGIEGVSGRADSVFENPAALARVDRFSSSLFTTTLMDEAVYQNFALAYRAGSTVFGLGFMNLGVDHIPKTAKMIHADGTSDPVVDYYFNYQDSLIKFSYQQSQSEMMHYGVSGTYYYREFDTVSASGYNLDLGVIIKGSRLEFSWLVRNALSSNVVTFSDSEIGENSSDGNIEKLSLVAVYSLQYKLRNFTLMGQLKTEGSSRDMSRAFAFEYKPAAMPVLNVSCGVRLFRFKHYEEGEVILDPKRVASFGFGLNLMGMNFDYAYERSDHVEYEHKHYFSAGYSF